MNTELFIDGMVPLYKRKTKISNMTNKRDQRKGILWLKEW